MESFKGRRKNQAQDMQQTTDGRFVFIENEDTSDILALSYFDEDSQSFLLPRSACTEFDRDFKQEGLLDRYIANVKNYFERYELRKAVYILKIKINTLKHYGISETLLLNKSILKIVSEHVDAYIHLSLAGIHPFNQTFDNLVSVKMLCDECGLDTSPVFKKNQDFLIKGFLDYATDLNQNIELKKIKSMYFNLMQVLDIDKFFIHQALSGVKLSHEGRKVLLLDILSENT